MPVPRRPLPVASAYAPWPDAVLFEVSWEVCHQVGGIYQVLRSKAPTMVERWGDRYLVVGPWMPRIVQVEFEPEEPRDFVADVLKRLAGEGLVIHHGRWLVSGRPRALLVEHGLGPATLGAVRMRLRNELGIDASSNDPLVKDVLEFGEAVRRLLRAVADTPARPPRLLAHFHEWVGGLALPLLRRESMPLATVFTTHATSVGRYVASSEAGLYDRLPYMDPDAEAGRMGIVAQHQIERACAQSAHVFTTLSPLTGEECER